MPSSFPRALRNLSLLLSVLALSACAPGPTRQTTRPAPTKSRVVPAEPAKPPILVDGPPAKADIPPNLAELPDAVPQPEPKSRYGNPDSYEVFGETYRPLESARGFRELGLASWYGRKFQGKKTSSGEPFDMFKMTAAHKTLPLPTYARVTNLTNGKSVVVRINDRGPFHKERVIDLSYAAATKLDLLGGPAMVELEAIVPGEPLPPPVGTLDELAEPVATGASNYLQVGAYSDPVNANALLKEIQKIGLKNAEVRQGVFHGAPIHRVIVGPFADEAKLKAAKSKLGAGGFASIPVHY